MMLFEELNEKVTVENGFIVFKLLIDEGTEINQKGDEISKELKWLKCIAGFANTQDGVMYVGVANSDHAIESFSKRELDHLTLMVHRQIKQKIEPYIHYSIEEIPVPNSDRYIFKIAVKKSKALPVMVHDSGAALIFVRSFGQTRLATPEEIRLLVLSSEYVGYDNYLTEEKYRREDYSTFLECARKRSKDQAVILSDKELASSRMFDRKGYLHQGSLLFRDDCLDSLTSVVCVKYDGIDKGVSRFLSTKRFLGPITKVIDEVLSYVEDSENTGYRKLSDGAKNVVRYPSRSLLEGVVNAFSHRNYFIHGGQIEVNIFVDRIEIISPGSLLNQFRLEKEKNIASIIPERRNEIISLLLETSFYAQNKGSGFDNIVSDYATSDDKHKPFVSSNENSFSLTLPNLEYRIGIIDETNPNPEVYVEGEVLERRELKILSYCYSLNRSAKDIALYCALKPSTYFRNDVLMPLVQKGYLLTSPKNNIPTYRSNPTRVKLVK